MTKRPVGRPPKERLDPEIEKGLRQTPIVDQSDRIALYINVEITLKNHGITQKQVVGIQIMILELIEVLLYYREALSMNFVKPGLQTTGPKPKIAEIALILDVRHILSKHNLQFKYWRNGRKSEDSLNELIRDLCHKSGINKRFYASSRSYNSKSFNYMPFI